jgi:hypothetical protein
MKKRVMMGQRGMMRQHIAITPLATIRAPMVAVVGERSGKRRYEGEGGR